MYPPIFERIKNSPACVALLKSGTGEIRFYQFGLAPQNVQKPYAVWRRVFGQPANYMGDVPDMDSFTIQIDCYASPDNANGATQVRNIAVAIRDAIEPVSYITNWLGESIDPETKNYAFRFQNDWFVERA